MKEIADAEGTALQEIDAKAAAEEAEEAKKAEEEKAAKEKEQEGKPKMRIVRERNDEIYDLFQTFDRPKQGRLPLPGGDAGALNLARFAVAAGAARRREPLSAVALRASGGGGWCPVSRTTLRGAAGLARVLPPPKGSFCGAAGRCS
eukprot:gene35753-3279_t